MEPESPPADRRSLCAFVSFAVDVFLAPARLVVWVLTGKLRDDRG